MKRRSVLRAAVAAGLATGLGTGCGTAAPPSQVDVVDPGPVTLRPTPTPALPAAPLTGIPVSAEALATRPAVAVPIRVGTDTSPAGLATADLVYQEYAEAGTLHLTAIFQSREADRIGPVTEIRPVDVRTLEVFRPVVGHTGGPTGFLRQFSDAGLTGVTPDRRAAAFQDGYTSTAALLAAAPEVDTAPTPVFDYATTGAPLATEDRNPAGELSIAVPGRPAQVWRYDNEQSGWIGQIGQVRVTVASVIVLTMPYRTITVNKPTRRSMPGAKVFGDGPALVVSGPVSAKGRWRKPGERMVCHVTDPAGYQIRPLPGTAWVIYAPTTAKVTVR